MTALLLPGWAGWIALTTWGLGFGTAGWMLGHRGGHARLDGMAANAMRQREVLKRALRKAERDADRYRLAWLSARRRARDATRYTEIMTGDYRPTAPNMLGQNIIADPADVTIAFDNSGQHDHDHVIAYIFHPPGNRDPAGYTPGEDRP